MRNRENIDNIRVRNPFLDPLVTELIENPDLYRRMFSERILVGETLQVFQPVNIVLLGPQGTGKSMILNLVRYAILADWLSNTGELPSPLRHFKPFFGISINLVRAGFHAFGRRSISRALRIDDPDKALDTTCASDFLNHYLFREFLRGVLFLTDPRGEPFANWLGISKEQLQEPDLVQNLSSWSSWFGYYWGCKSLDDLLTRCEQRLATWRSFLNANIDTIPNDIWESKSGIGEPLHDMGNFLSSLSTEGKLPVFVVIDQYEVLPELNRSHGTALQRAVNTLIKARDPVVFYKLGARTYDWGTELRIWGAESRIEVQRDYVTVNLSDVLTRRENRQGWLFPKLALDVAYKRIRQGRFSISRKRIPLIFGRWDPDEESRRYFRDREGWFDVLRGLDDETRSRIQSACGPDASPLQLRLAAAWDLERQKRGVPKDHRLRELSGRPWTRKWWQKERRGVGLLQIASMAKQRKIYYGLNDILYLSGGNITAFLLLCNEIWDVATKLGYHPLRQIPLPYNVQTQGVYIASEKWRTRDRNELLYGRKRYEVLGRLGPSIHDALIGDLAISNPGHSGFSLRESELWEPSELGDPRGKVATFLNSSVSWAILEERPHTSKTREGASRRKWYLHPLLSPSFQIPHVRVKEPFYTDVATVYKWLFSSNIPTFGPTLSRSVAKTKNGSAQQLTLPLET